ncbi:MAG: glycosyltransferase family 39 protein [DPANN group archaeon]|nr:glycosyltransferase family 39 protein [DPANN group archaeon]
MDELEQRKTVFFSKLKGWFGVEEIGKDIKGIHLRNPLNSAWLYLILLAAVLVLAAYLRTRNLGLLQGRYMIELDSYFFFRYSKMILETGTLPAIDLMRYVPVGVPTAPFKFFPLTMVYWYKFFHLLMPNLKLITWHIYYPVVVTLISFVFFFLFVRKLFGDRVALVSTAFLAVLPAYIQRTSAGFADHEAMAMLWMFISLWLFVEMWQSNNIKKTLLAGSLSGFFAALMAGTWGGFSYLAATVGFSLLLSVFFSKIDRRQFYGYLSLYIVLSIFYSIIKDARILDWVKSTESLAFLVLPMIIYAAFEFTKNTKIMDAASKFAPKQIVSSLAVFLVAGLAVPFLGKIGVVDFASFKEFLVSAIFRTNVSRWATTVAENAQPTFWGSGGWWNTFGFVFFLVLAGSLALLASIFKNKSVGWLDFKRQQPMYFISATYLLFFVAFIFGRWGRSSKFSALFDFFSRNYVIWLILFMVALIAVYIFAYKRADFENIFTKENSTVIIMLVLFLFSLVSSRILIRLLFTLAPAAAIMAGWFVTKGVEKAGAQKKWRLAAIILILFSALAFYAEARETYNDNRGIGSMVPGQWEASMNFLRENTPKDSVVAHWWDYGHMTTAIGERAAVTDGGNAMGWNHDSGRYFLTGKDKTSTLEYLKSHNVTHILISSQEIPKYYAFSLIGSDENLDRLSTIGMFGLQNKKETRDGYQLSYGGAWGLDKDYVFGDSVLPAGGGAITGFSIDVSGDNRVTGAKAIIDSNGRSIAADVSCIYIHKYNPDKQSMVYGSRTNLPAGSNNIKGCMVVLPGFQDNRLYENGAVMWLSEKVWDTNLARLYVYGESDPNFAEVYSDDLPLGFYNGQIIGPIKIWNVMYPPGVKTDKKYLEPSKYG